MNRLIQYIFLSSFLFLSVNGNSQDTNTVELHFQIYDEGICLPMIPSVHYGTSKYQKTKSVFQSGSYYSTLYVAVNSSDSGYIQPQVNHKLQASSLKFNPELEYELTFLRYDGFNRDNPKTMSIKIFKLEKNAQLILQFKEGEFSLKKMKLFKELKKGETPDFKSVIRKKFKNKLILDSTSYFANGNKKANYYLLSTNFPLYYIQEFDSINSNFYSQGFHLLSYYKNKQSMPVSQSIWGNSVNTKYGYWEYFENGKQVKHEFWASMLQQKFEWYPSGKLKFEGNYGQSNKNTKQVYYLENGAIIEEFYSQSRTRKSFIKTYSYSPQGNLILINTYNSSNGITKQGLQKREIFYPSGKLKMEENYIGTYTIKYYKEDGTERIN